MQANLFTLVEKDLCQKERKKDTLVESVFTFERTKEFVFKALLVLIIFILELHKILN